MNIGEGRERNCESVRTGKAIEIRKIAGWEYLIDL